MHKKTSFAKRAMSLLLVTVMVLGMLPGITLPVSADVSLGGVANPSTYTGNGPKYGFSYDASGNFFTRFTLVEIPTSDHDSVKSGQINKGDGKDGPDFFSDGSAWTWSKYKILGSVDISATGNNAIKDNAKGALWFDTNAIGYQAVVNGQGDASTVTEYLEKHTKENFASSKEGTRKGFYYMEDFKAKHNISSAQVTLPSWVFDGSSSDIKKLFSAQGESGRDGQSAADVEIMVTSNQFMKALIDELGPGTRPNEDPEKKVGTTGLGSFMSPTWNNYISGIFDIKDDVTYRIIAEEGIIIRNKTTGVPMAMTVRDIAAMGISDKFDKFRYDMCGDQGLQRIANALMGTTKEFHGYYYDEPSDSFIVTKEESRTGVFYATETKMNKSKGKARCEAVFGMDKGSAPNIPGSQYGMFIVTPYYFEKQGDSLRIRKTLGKGMDGDKDTAFTFQVFIDNDTDAEFEATLVYNGKDESAQTITVPVGGYNQTVTLKGDEYCDIKGLPAGTEFEVTEDGGGTSINMGPNGCFTRVQNSGADNKDWQSGATTSGKLDDSGSATVMFENSKETPPPPDPDPHGDPGDPGGDPGTRYWVYWDYNYDGGGKTSCEGGTHFLQWSRPKDPIREGYSFLGWALDDPFATSGTREAYDPGGPNHTYYAVWESDDINWYANGGTWNGTVPENCTQLDGAAEMTFMKGRVWPKDPVKNYREEIPVPSNPPTREGYTFTGWFRDKECTEPLNYYEEGVAPGNYYAGWTAEKVIVTYYDVRQGTGAIVRQDEYLYNDLFDLLDGMNSTDGWTWKYWADKDGNDVTSWDGKMYLNKDTPCISYENQDEPDGSVNSDKHYWKLDLYATWEEEKTFYDLRLVYNDFQNNDGVRPKTVTFGLVDSYMNNEVIQRATVKVDETANEQYVTGLFSDLPVEDNDASVQKRTYKIVPLEYTDARGTPYRITAPAIDGYEADWDVQTVSDADNRTLSSYRVHLNNYGDSDNGGSGGYNPGGGESGNYYSIITFDHSLITTGDDIKFVMRWDDDGDNDGMRPGSVKLVLYANGQTVRKFPMHNSQTGAVDANAAICEVTDDGNTWTYIFRDYQKYHEGKAIEYTVAVRNDEIDPVTYEGTTFDRYGYTTEYMVNRTNGDTIGDPHGAVFHRTVETQEIPIRIVWKDENNRDGQRPDYVALALTSYQWNDHTYCWENQEVETVVIRADDKNTMTASEWTYTFVPNKVYNDGVRRVYHLAVTSDLNAFIPEGSFLYGWEETAYGNQYPTNGGRNDEGYNKGMSTPRDPVTEVTISQNTNTVSVTGNIYWDDVNNQDNIRPRNVIMQLYAHAPHNPGSAVTSDPWPVKGQAYRVTVAGDPEADNWYYTFSNLPKYVDGLSGVELVYTIKIEEVDGEPLYGTYIITDNGPEETIIRYTPSYLTEQPEEDGMTAVDGLYETSDFNKSDRPYVKLYHKTETQTVDFGINWHDSNNQDRVRPTEVNVNLWKQVGDAEPVKLFDKPLMFSAMDTGAGTAWTKKLTGLSNYENGEKVTFILDMDEDEIKRLGDIGYTVTIEGNIVHMYYKTAVGDVTAKVTWSDSNNNDGYRPDNVTAELYRNGAATGDIVNLNEGNGWTFTWTGLDVKYIDNGSYGLDVVYSVKVNVPDAYTVTYTPESVTIPQGLPLDITLSHVGDTRTVPVTVFWNDNSDKDGKRPETVTVQLLADGKVLEGKTLTLSAADFTGNTWKGSFDGLPTYTDNGTPVRYSVRVEDETATNGVYQIMTAGSTLYLSHDPVLSDLSVSSRLSRL